MSRHLSAGYECSDCETLAAEPFYMLHDPPNPDRVICAVCAEKYQPEPDDDPCDCGTVFGESGMYLPHAIGAHADCTGED